MAVSESNPLNPKQETAVMTTDGKETAIVLAARQAFLARGYDAASMDYIAEQASVSKRTVYNRFRSKEALFAASILDMCQHFIPMDLAEIEERLPPHELLAHLAGMFLRGILAPEAIALRRIAAFETSRTPALGAAYLENGPNMMVKLCIPILGRMAQRVGVEVSDPETAIWQLGALITEPLYTRVLMGEVPDDLDAAIEYQLRTGLEAFFKIHRLG